MAGDFNARLNTQLPPPPFHTAAHSQQLLQLCRHTTLQLCTGRSPGDTHAPPTFRGRGPYPGTRLNHILISPSLNDRLTSSSVDTSRQESDHYPTQARFQLMPLARGQPAARSHCGARLPRVQWQPSCQAAYAAAVQAGTHKEFQLCAAAIAAGDLTAAFRHLHSGLQAAADESGLPRRSSHPRSTAQHHQPFYDAECKALKRQVRHLFQTQPGSEAAKHAENSTIAWYAEKREQIKSSSYTMSFRSSAAIPAPSGSSSNLNTQPCQRRYRNQQPGTPT
ncbi:g3593 [Coccomyxa elongata]